MICLHSVGIMAFLWSLRSPQLVVRLTCNRVMKISTQNSSCGDIQPVAARLGTRKQFACLGTDFETSIAVIEIITQACVLVRRSTPISF